MNSPDKKHTIYPSVFWWEEVPAVGSRPAKDSHLNVVVDPIFLSQALFFQGPWVMGSLQGDAVFFLTKQFVGRDFFF